MACGLRLSGIMPPEPVLDVFTRSDVAAACFAAPQNIDIEHEFFRSRPFFNLGPAGFEPATS